MDVVLVGFVAALTFGGWRTGFLHRLAGLLFIAVSFIVGAYLRGPFGDLVHRFYPDVPGDYASLIGYAFAFPVILAILHIVAYPFLKGRHMHGMTRELDRALGAIVGFIEGVLILSVVVVIFDTYFSAGIGSGTKPGLSAIESLTAAFNESYTVHLLRATTVPIVLTVLGPLLPRDISTLIPGGTPTLPGFPGLPGAPTPKR
jgi:hypothetical protein